MKNKLWLWLMLSPCVCFGSSNKVSDQCTTAQVLAKIRPGAAWSMQGDSIKTLKWMDTKQTKPSASEVEKAKQTCVAETEIREQRKIQARLDVKNPDISVEKKVDALILLLNLDK